MRKRYTKPQITENASDAEDRILATIRERFDVRGVFRVRWSRESFREDLVRFYSHSQKHLGSREIRRVMRGKMKHCGDGDFLLIVFLDPSPAYGPKTTSSGRRTVNTTVFDLKMELREWVGGGHKIHASDDPSETRQDLTLLLGEQHAWPWSGTERLDGDDVLTVHRDVTGVMEFASLAHLLGPLRFRGRIADPGIRGLRRFQLRHRRRLRVRGAHSEADAGARNQDCDCAAQAFRTHYRTP